jgi:hypothetical protein
MVLVGEQFQMLQGTVMPSSSSVKQTKMKADTEALQPLET